jgi:hypothetical protein
MSGFLSDKLGGLCGFYRLLHPWRKLCLTILIGSKSGRPTKNCQFHPPLISGNIWRIIVIAAGLTIKIKDSDPVFSVAVFSVGDPIVPS